MAQQPNNLSSQQTTCGPTAEQAQLPIFEPTVHHFMFTKARSLSKLGPKLGRLDYLQDPFAATEPASAGIVLLPPPCARRDPTWLPPTSPPSTLNHSTRWADLTMAQIATRVFRGDRTTDAVADQKRLQRYNCPGQLPIVYLRERGSSWIVEATWESLSLRLDQRIRKAVLLVGREIEEIWPAGLLFRREIKEIQRAVGRKIEEI
ncbi:tyrosine-protein kinase JAK2 [Striga asiatica]|uniref:Tyrosine-protein kinase JAK2 n=1 Tax=Striga asiatica TaxID=4170 RepID=A0A5A7QAN5_STRAF|nr:tyrosine-protein kinase JAK2 [Striga asiatica]